MFQSGRKQIDDPPALAQNATTEEEALAHYQRLVRMRPDQPTLQANIGFAYLQLGKPGEAVPHYEQVVESRPMDAHAHMDLGYALLRAGRTDDALASYRKAVEIAPKDAAVHHGLATRLCWVRARNAASESTRTSAPGWSIRLDRRRLP